MKWILVTKEGLPKDDIDEVVVKTSLGVKEIMDFHNGEWDGDLRGDEKVIKWLDETDDPIEDLKKFSENRDQ